MDSIIDTLRADPEELRRLTLAGPAISYDGRSQPLWMLQAGAPSFHRKHALDAQGKPTGTMADQAHPVRVLAVDQGAQVDHHWMRPRLLDLHLVVGAQNGHYRQRRSPTGYLDKDHLLLGWSPKGQEVAADRGAGLRSVTEGKDQSNGEAPFVHVVAEALADGMDDWYHHAAEDAIPLPPMRLIGGRIGLRVNLERHELKWLARLGIVGARTAKQDWATWPTIWLVPDGIEFDAELPFPGRFNAPPLVGRVLLHAQSSSSSALQLKLISPVDPAQWAAAWAQITPAAGDDTERLLGLKFVGRSTDAGLPTFSWPVPRQQGGEPNQLRPGAVTVAGPDCQLLLVSPSMLGVVDSVATLGPRRLTVRDETISGKQVVRFDFADGSEKGALTVACKCEPNAFSLETDENGDINLDVDLARLAGELREAHGLETPPPVPLARPPGIPYGEPFARPVLSAFVPLENGWLQLPVPNLGPLDTSSDQVLASTPRATSRNVLSGFFRLRHVGIGDTVQSGFDRMTAPQRTAQAPWSVTVERAAGMVGYIYLQPGTGGASATLLDATISLYDPVLSTRGLLWLAADRPDAQEALPRLGAGPGAFLDVVMHSPEASAQERPALGATFVKLTVGAKKANGIQARLDWETMSLYFRTDSQRWAGELLKPTEARKALVRAARCIDASFPDIPDSSDRPAVLLGQVDQHTENIGTQLAGVGIDHAAAQAHIATLLKDGALALPLKQAGSALRATARASAGALKEATKANKALRDARQLLPSQVLKNQRPWPAVAWLRHPAIALAAEMPMTRAAGGSQRPLESRDLQPYALTPGSDKKAVLLPLAILAPSAHMPLLALRAIDGTAFSLAPVATWPQAASAPDSAPDRGIGFAAVGVPGVELRVLPPGPKDGGRPLFEAALRYDLPLLDEAFATAALPPVPDAPTRSDPLADANPAPTALDWPLLANFWAEQERKHQNSRVQDSYLSSFLPVDAEKVVPVTSLVKGLTWSPKLRMDAYSAGASPALPYGALALDGAAAVAGNAALPGYANWLVRKSGSAQLIPGKADDRGAIRVLGFSPATFRQDDVELDNVMSGAGPAEQPVSSLLIRPLTVNGSGSGLRQVSLTEPLAVTINGKAFAFWFKDVLFDGDNARLEPDAQAPLAFDALSNDARLAFESCEWRFGPGETQDLRTAFVLGRDELPFFGFRLEPLRLLELSLAGDAIASLTLLCRLTLSPRSDTGNLMRLTLTRSTLGELAPSFALADSTQPLRFGLRLVEGLRERRVLATAEFGTDQTFALRGLGLEIEVSGFMIDLGVPEIDLHPGENGKCLVTIGASPQAAPLGRSRLRIAHACIRAGYQIDADGRLLEVAPTLDWHRTLELFVQGEHAEPTQPALEWPLESNANLVLLGKAAPASISDLHEANGALSCTIDAVFKAAKGGAQARVKAAIVVRLDPPVLKDGSAQLAAGHCDGVFSQDGAPYAGHKDGLCGPGIEITGARLHFTLTAEGKDDWVGHASIDATIRARSDIAWPSLTASASAREVPLPGARPLPRSGRVLVIPGTAAAASHEVRWTLMNHRLPLALVGAILRPGSTAVWVTPVTARHRLQRDSTVLTWTGVESIALGRPVGLVPPVPDDLKNDAITFAARYGKQIVKGEYVGKEYETGMLRAGAGAVATVLQGALGSAFRKLFWKASPADRIVLAGGFLGMLKIAPGAEAAPLLRLPVLAGLDIMIGQGALGKGLELAWNDGPAARAVALTRPGAPSPANASYDALAAAMQAGSLARAPDAGEVAALACALLVEQSFGEPVPETDLNLAGTPFFLAAAVSVNALLDGAPAAREKTEAALVSLSFVAGELHWRTDKAVTTVPVAAALEMRDTLPAQMAATQRSGTSRLYVLGRGVQSKPWTGNAVPDASSRPYLRALAATIDPDPAGVLLAWHGREGDVAYVHGTIESLALDRGLPHHGAPSAFADGRRGVPVVPDKDRILRWLAPAHEGPGKPIRDDADSGLAGLARRITLPASAAAARSLAPQAVAPDMVWLAQTQVPVYLPLQIAGLRGEPIGWLQNAAPRARLPVDDEVIGTIRDSTPRGEAPADVPPLVQSFTPGQLAGASVGERAGIMTLRRIRMLARLDGSEVADIGAYDAVHARFGAPAQAGSSFARKLRTPRPNILPPNRDDPARDRRIQAALVRPFESATAFYGSADIVQGSAGRFQDGESEHAFSDWSIEVVASPESASVVSERWDGSVRLVCRISVRFRLPEPGAAALPSPAAFLVTALGLDRHRSGARLKIGTHLLAYRWLVLDKKALGTVWSPDPVQPDGPEFALRQPRWATIALVLGPRESPLALRASASLADIANAFNLSPVLPPVELQWSFQPGSWRALQTPTNVPLELRAEDAAGRSLVEGSAERAPLTLRMPLYPVARARGALPLTPASLIFSDPAFDRDLAGPPVSSIDRLTPKGGADERGELRLILSADRGRVNRRGVVTLMLDVAYEQRMDELAQAVAEAKGAVPSGDLKAHVAPDTAPEVARVTLVLVPVNGKAREVKFGQQVEAQGKPDTSELRIALATVYEMPLSQLVEADGKPADLQPGDVLQVSAAIPAVARDGTATSFSPSLWNSRDQKFNAVDITLEPVPNCTIVLTLTDEAVVEPPPALYLAMQRSKGPDGWRLGVPLHAQSPLPRRVDLMDPARGFRTGLMRRHADFVWYLACPATMLGPNSLAVHKSDRNGQGYWPMEVDEFLTPVDLNIP